MLEGTHAALQLPQSSLESLEEGLLALERLRPPLRHLEIRSSPNGELYLVLLGFDDHRSFTVQRACVEALARLLPAELTDVSHLEGEALRAFAERVHQSPLEAHADGNLAEAFAQLRQHASAHTLRVSFGSDDELLNAWARSIAEGGFWVPTSADLSGERFRLTFVTPDATYPANPATRIERPPPQLARHGLWLEVKAGEALAARVVRAQQERRERLSRRTPQPIERFEGDLELVIDGLAQLATCWRDELSHGALFVPTEKPPALRARLRLHLQLPDGAIATIPAEVVHRVLTGPRIGVGLQLERAHEHLDHVVELLADPPRRPKVLVVDDEAIWRSTLVRVLKELDADILLAKDGHEGLNKLIDHFFDLDLVILDLHMPELDGRGLLDRVRRLGGEQALKIFLFSAAGRDELKEAGQLATGIFSKLDPLHLLASQLAKELGRPWPPAAESAAA